MRTESPWTPLALALRDVLAGDAGARVTVHVDDGTREELPAAYFFRPPAEMPPGERRALELCRGPVLDLGAGAGSHALVLQERGLEVTAVDIAPIAVEVMRARGVRDPRCGDLYPTGPGIERFRTVLLLMNGIGAVEDLPGLDRFLEHAASVLHPEAQILFDSTDWRRLTDPEERRAARRRRRAGRYEGEVRFSMEYRGHEGGWFGWLFVDPDRLAEAARPHGWAANVMETGDGDGEYLVRLSR